MDVSKLPRLSKSDPPPDNAGPPGEPPPNPVRDDRPLAPDIGLAGTIWISLIIGVLLLFMGRSFAGWAVATMMGRHYNTNLVWPPTAGEKANQPVTYWEVQGLQALSDSAIFLFGLAMVLEGVALAYVHTRLRGKAAVLIMAVGLAFLATVHNLYVAARLWGIGILPVMSILAIAFGGYMVMYQWKLLQLLRTGQAAPMT